MISRKSFVEKLIRRFDRLDSATLRHHMDSILAENEFLWSVLDAFSSGVLIASGKGMIEWANTAAQDILGIRDFKTKGIRLSEIEDPDASYFFERYFSDPPPQISRSLHLYLPREAELTVTIRRLAGDRYLILLDPRPFGQEQMETRMARIESLLKLTAGIAHEVGNPLNALTIHLELLRKEAEKIPASSREKILNGLDVLKAETGRLDRIVRDFLSATRKPPLRFKQEDLVRVMEDAIDFMKPELIRRKIVLSFKAADTIPAFMMDRDRIYQAFMNLIKNAMDAMPEGGPLAIHIFKKGKCAVIKIRDHGIGIRPEDMPYIFDAYYTSKRDGAGLGLMTVQHTVAEHAGRIEAASKWGKGTSFTITLPVRQPKLQLPKPESVEKKKRS